MFVEKRFGDLPLLSLFVLNGNGCRKLSEDSYNFYPTFYPETVSNVSPNLIIKVFVRE